MDNVAIGPALSDELEAASNLRGEMATEMGHNWDVTYPGWRARFASYFRAKQDAGAAQVFFAHSEGRAVGMVIVSLVDDYRAYAFNQPRGYVNGVYVAPQFRRHGIARAMMLIGLEWLRERGCVVARLRSSKDGRALYTSLGFTAGTEMELSF